MRINKHIAVSDSGFVFNPVTGESFSANPLGVEIIQLLKQGVEPDHIVDEVLKQYQAEQATVEKDVNEFLELLRSFSLIDRHEQAED